MPRLKLVLRHLLSSPEAAAVLPQQMNPLEAAVLTDLRQALRAMHGARR